MRDGGRRPRSWRFQSLSVTRKLPTVGEVEVEVKGEGQGESAGAGEVSGEAEAETEARHLGSGRKTTSESLGWGEYSRAQGLAPAPARASTLTCHRELKALLRDSESGDEDSERTRSRTAPPESL